MVACYPLIPRTPKLFLKQICPDHHMLWGKANCACLSAILDEDTFDDSLNTAILKLHYTQNQLQQITHPNIPPAALMLLTCSPIGRAVEHNNFLIAAHLDLKT